MYMIFSAFSQRIAIDSAPCTPRSVQHSRGRRSRACFCLNLPMCLQPCSVAQYRDMALSEDRLPPPKCAPLLDCAQLRGITCVC